MSKGGKLLFVYDTMQSGYSNNIALQDCELKGRGTTVKEFTMWHADGVVRLTQGGAKPIHGEVYSLPGGKLEALDKMEGVGQKGVTRIEEQVTCAADDGSARDVTAFVFVCTEESVQGDEWVQLKSGRVQEGVLPDDGLAGGEDDDDDDDGDDDEDLAGEFRDSHHPPCEMTGVAGIMEMMAAAKNGADGGEPMAKRQKQE
eukprot:TRINITY_DN17412_c0_g1_i1.p3 TRINITY_DN17412_c0_g1~~TRINITY_DN17412_c0_g1_i1.p3  ORF type:complete len:201 (+),score=55.53 TRINITY_DN17412_c0_g1_i1:51-653(+)